MRGDGCGSECVFDSLRSWFCRFGSRCSAVRFGSCSEWEGVYFCEGFFLCILNAFLELEFLEVSVFRVVLLRVVRGTLSMGSTNAGVKWSRSWLKWGRQDSNWCGGRAGAVEGLWGGWKWTARGASLWEGRSLVRSRRC
jgi:hypothetical protein